VQQEREADNEFNELYSQSESTDNQDSQQPTDMAYSDNHAAAMHFVPPSLNWDKFYHGLHLKAAEKPVQVKVILGDHDDVSCLE